MRYKRNHITTIDFIVCLRIIFSLIILCFIFLSVNFWRVQIKDGEKYKKLASSNRIRRVILPARRGNIYDRNGELLVENKPSFNVTITKEDFKTNKDVLLQKLPSILGISAEEIKKCVQSKSYFQYMPATIAKNITIEQLTFIEEAYPTLPGIIIEVEPIRSYTYSRFCSHLLGNVGLISLSEYDQWKKKTYTKHDIVGKTGIEAAYEEYLRGEHGGMQVQVDNKGFFDEIIAIKEPTPGNDLHLTVDKNIQDALEEAYLEQTGAAVVMNPNNGAILAMISKPDFDPNIFVTSSARKEVGKLLIDESFPLLNKTIAGEFPAGSIFKLIMALAALKEKTISPETTFFCNGSFHLGKSTVFRCWNKSGHGTVNLSHAIMQSCNVFFYNTGNLMGNIPIYNMGKQFGLGEKTGIEVLGEKAGILPNNEWKREKLNDKWYGGDTINLSIGQGYLLVTPLQLAVMLSAIANNGTIYQPITATKTVSPQGKLITTFNPVGKRKLELNQKELDLVKQGMWRVINDKDGTAKRARLKDIEVAGKTGTIQVMIKGEKKNHAWFACFAPFKDPEVVVITFVEFGRSGGGSAAPLAKKALEAYFYKPTLKDNIQKENINAN